MKNKLLALVLFLVPVAVILAQVPPPPTQGDEDAGTPGASGTPIDQYMMILFGLAILLAVYRFWYLKRQQV